MDVNLVLNSLLGWVKISMYLANVRIIGQHHIAVERLSKADLIKKIEKKYI